MFISFNNLASILGTSAATISSWGLKGKYPVNHNDKGIPGFEMEYLSDLPLIRSMLESNWEEELKVNPLRTFTSVELFAGAGGLALGMEMAGFHHILLNEFETAACNTLRANRPNWNVIEGDVRHIDFSPLRNKVDLLTGGFPCQAFSFAGKQGGFEDVRGTLFFELARAVKEINPKVLMAENVKGLVSHDNGRTFKTICNIISELGYTLISPRILKGVMYKVPQKRERIILVAIRNDIAPFVEFKWPSPFRQITTLKDAFYKGILYDCDVLDTEGASYPASKREVLELVPQGGDWRDLPEDIAKKYMGKSWYLGGGKTGMARRLSIDEPSLTLTCAPAQKQTERCHPFETRPLSIREYARIQTFPDYWIFKGSLSDKYKQIGNAVPVNLAWAVGRSLIRLFNQIEQKFPSPKIEYDESIKTILEKNRGLITVKDRKNQISHIKSKQLSLFDLSEESGNVPMASNQIICDSSENYNDLPSE